MKMDLGWLLRRLFGGWLRQAVEAAAQQGLRPPVVIPLQSGSIKGRLIIDSW